MSTEENKTLVRRFIEAYNKRDAIVLNAVLSPDDAKEYIETHIPRNSAQWGDEHVQITDMMAEGDRVWARMTHSGRHIGEYEGLPPTGKTKTSAFAMFFRIANGKIVEEEGLGDTLDEIKQIGGTVVPKER